MSRESVPIDLVVQARERAAIVNCGGVGRKLEPPAGPRYRASVPGQPFLKVCEFNRSRLLQGSRSESPHPVVVDAEGRCYGPVLAYTGPHGFPRMLDPLLYGC